MKNATANPTAAMATMPAPTPPTIAPTLAPELVLAALADGLGAMDKIEGVADTETITVAG